MPANTSPIFILTPRTETCEITASNTARDGSGSLVNLFTAGANGSRVDFITFNNAQNTPTSSSLMIGRVFVTDTSGSNPRLLSEISLSAVTASNTAVGATNTIFYSNGLLLGTGQSLRVCQSVYSGSQDKVHVIARGGDY